MRGGASSSQITLWFLVVTTAVLVAVVIRPTAIRWKCRTKRFLFFADGNYALSPDSKDRHGSFYLWLLLSVADNCDPPCNILGHFRDECCTQYKHTHTQLFHGSLNFVRDNAGEPVPEVTFTHSHSSWSSIIPICFLLLPPSTTIHGILPIQSKLFIVFFPQSLSKFSLVCLLAWHPPLSIKRYANVLFSYKSYYGCQKGKSRYVLVANR